MTAEKGRSYSQSLWCVRKHLGLSKIHLSETQQKLFKECNVGDPGCDISEATCKEADCALNNFLAAEEHLADEIIPKLQHKTQTSENPELIKITEDLKDLSDQIRSLRQKFVQTGLPIYSTEIPNVTSTEFGQIQEATELFKKRLDSIASPLYEQEQQGLEGIACVRCGEDLGEGADTPPLSGLTDLVVEIEEHNKAFDEQLSKITLEASA